MILYATLKLVWFFLIYSLFLGFAILGGMDLGVAILLPFLGSNDTERRLILKSIGPTWEGNQVWFITAAGALFAAWPLVYATAFSILYGPLLLVLLSLILRPPGIDFRSKLPSPRWRKGWDSALFISGLLPALLFGVVFGNLLSGFSFEYDDSLRPILENTFIDFLSPLPLFCGGATLSLLVLQGAYFIQLKTPEPLESRARNAACLWTGIFVLTFSLAWYWTTFKTEGFAITSLPDLNHILTPLQKSVQHEKGLWLQNYQRYPLGYLAPITSILGVFLAFWASQRRWPALAFFFNSVALTATLCTAGFTLFPFILPSTLAPNHSLTIWDACSTPLTLLWMLGAVSFFLPLILGYTHWIFRVMKGKVDPLQSQDY